MKTLTMIATLIAAIALIAGCTENQRAKMYGGTSVQDLPRGRKLVNATWKDNNLWMLTRPMHPDETPEEWRFNEASSFGLIQGEVIIRETRLLSHE